MSHSENNSGKDPLGLNVMVVPGYSDQKPPPLKQINSPAYVEGAVPGGMVEELTRLGGEVVSIDNHVDDKDPRVK